MLDSRVEILSSSTELTIRREVDRLNAYAWEQRENARRSARDLAFRARQLAEGAGYRIGQTHSLIALAFSDFREGHGDEALEKCFEVLETLPASVWCLRLYNLLGMIYFELGERAEGLTYFEKQRSLSQVLGDREMEALAQHDIAVYHLEGEAKRVMLERALDVFKALNAHTYKAIALFNLSEYHLAQEAPETALTCLEQVLSSSSVADMIVLQVMALGARMRCYSALQDEARALATFEEASRLAEAHAPQLRSYCQLHLGVFHQTFSRHAEACTAFERGLEYEPQNKLYILDGHRLLAECYAETGDYARAYTQQKRFQTLHEDLFKEGSEQKVRALEVIYRTRSAQHEAELERARNTELREHIAQLEALNAQVRELSLRDALTGLYNRRYFTEKLNEHFVQLARGRASLGLILLDIDHFKKVNDTLGHAAGDAVLVGVAKLLREQVRDSDIVARHGGEEFAILLPQHDLGRTLKIAERIRAAVERQVWTVLEGTSKVTLSIGVAMSASCLDADDLLRQADAQLYEAKRQGRNRVCVDVSG